MSIEIERKYIIRMPDFEFLESLSDYSVSEILQIYLKSELGVTHRVRKRTFAERTVCTETRKVRIDKMSATEDEHEISLTDFDSLSANIKEGTRPISKVRHTFVWGILCYEIDVYPEWEHTCIMEVELDGEDMQVDIPPFIKVVDEVTGNKAYSNASMSRRFPDEVK